MADPAPGPSSLESESLAFLERAARRATAALEAARALIRRGEDGPATMLGALQLVDEHLGAIETEAAILQALVSDLAGLATHLREQRDEALAGRDEALAVLEQILAWSETDDPAAALRWLAAMLRDTGQADLPSALHQLMHNPSVEPP